jgi:hypothetical protein
MEKTNTENWSANPFEGGLRALSEVMNAHEEFQVLLSRVRQLLRRPVTLLRSKPPR